MLSIGRINREFFRTSGHRGALFHLWLCSSVVGHGVEQLELVSYPCRGQRCRRAGQPEVFEDPGHHMDSNDQVDLPRQGRVVEPGFR